MQSSVFIKSASYHLTIIFQYAGLFALIKASQIESLSSFSSSHLAALCEKLDR